MDQQEREIKKSLNERFLEAINYLIQEEKVRNITDFAYSIGYSPQRLSGIKTAFSKEKKALNKNVTALMLYHTSVIYPDINIDYIITGRGTVTEFQMELPAKTQKVLKRLKKVTEAMGSTLDDLLKE